MPTYNYKCECGFVFDKLRKISERSHAECPECGTLASQQISAPKCINSSESHGTVQPKSGYKP